MDDWNKYRLENLETELANKRKELEEAQDEIEDAEEEIEGLKYKLSEYEITEKAFDDMTEKQKVKLYKDMKRYKKRIDSAKKLEKFVEWEHSGEAVLVALVLVVAAILNATYGINENQVGVVTRFGKAVRIVNSGFHVKFPFVESIKKIDVSGKQNQIEASAASKDMQEVHVKLSVNHSIARDNVMYGFTNYGKKYKDQYVEEILTPVVQQTIKEITAKHSAKEIVANREVLKEGMLETIKQRTQEKGITVTDANLIDVTFSEGFMVAIESKAVAEQEIENARTALEKAKIMKEIAITEAEVVAEAQRLQKGTLDDETLKKLFIDKWNGELPLSGAEDYQSYVFDILND